jgi:hypothetical protein
MAAQTGGSLHSVLAPMRCRSGITGGWLLDCYTSSETDLK